MEPPFSKSHYILFAVVCIQVQSRSADKSGWLYKTGPNNKVRTHITVYTAVVSVPCVVRAGRLESQIFRPVQWQTELLQNRKGRRST